MKLAEVVALSLIQAKVQLATPLCFPAGCEMTNGNGQVRLDGKHLKNYLRADAMEEVVMESVIRFLLIQHCGCAIWKKQNWKWVWEEEEEVKLPFPPFSGLVGNFASETRGDVCISAVVVSVCI